MLGWGITMNGPLDKLAPLMHPLCISHGTLTCRSFADSRPLYEEFLGLECVQHEERAMLLTVGRQFALVCIQVGDAARGVNVLRHWGIDVESRAEVDRMHALAEREMDRFGIRKVHHVTDQHGAYSFYFEDRDGNWWEIEHVGTKTHHEVFERGEVLPR